MSGSGWGEKGGRQGGREGGREGGRKGGREGGRKEGGRDGGCEGGREGGREAGRGKDSKLVIQQYLTSLPPSPSLFPHLVLRVQWVIFDAELASLVKDLDDVRPLEVMKLLSLAVDLVCVCVCVCVFA